MTEHTPGYVVEHAPRQSWAWEVRWTNNLNGFAKAGRCFARCPSKREAQKIANALNAQAVAPDLLAALETIFTSTWPPSCPPDWCDMMRAAIAKAKGQ